MIAIALLRGLNLGPHNRIKMPELTHLFEEAGCREVRTYIQSGNVLFSAPAAVLARVPQRVEAALAAREVNSPVVLRSAAELAAIVAGNPFEGAPPKSLHVGFLAASPTKAAVASLDPNRSPPDAFVLKGRELYLSLPNGAARSKLTTAYFDAKLKTLTTVRNWNTVRELARLANG